MVSPPALLNLHYECELSSVPWLAHSMPSATGSKGQGQFSCSDTFECLRKPLVGLALCCLVLVAGHEVRELEKGSLVVGEVAVRLRALAVLREDQGSKHLYGISQTSVTPIPGQPYT